MGVVLSVTLKDVFEESLDDRAVALFTAWMLVRAKSPDEARSRLLPGAGDQESIVAKGFSILVNQYQFFMGPLYGGKPQSVLFKLTDDAFSARKGWRSMDSLGFAFEPAE